MLFRSLLAAASEHEAYIRGETLARSVDFGGVAATELTAAGGNGAAAANSASAATIEGRELRIALARAA